MKVFILFHEVSRTIMGVFDDIEEALKEQDRLSDKNIFVTLQTHTLVSKYIGTR